MLCPIIHTRRVCGNETNRPATFTSRALRRVLRAWQCLFLRWGRPCSPTDTGHTQRRRTRASILFPARAHVIQQHGPLLLCLVLASALVRHTRGARRRRGPETCALIRVQQPGNMLPRRRPPSSRAELITALLCVIWMTTVAKVGE